MLEVSPHTRLDRATRTLDRSALITVRLGIAEPEVTSAGGRCPCSSSSTNDSTSSSSVA